MMETPRIMVRLLYRNGPSSVEGSSWKDEIEDFISGICEIDCGVPLLGYAAIR